MESVFIIIVILLKIVQIVFDIIFYLINISRLIHLSFQIVYGIFFQIIARVFQICKTLHIFAAFSVVTI